jgi:hypothetical protein
MIHLLWLSLLVPIILHLVHRRKAKVMPFSTLRFLQLIDQRVARRQRLKELLLLALRILLLAALVGALEKLPLSVGESSLPTTAVALLDNTGSMQAVRQGAGAFARAQAACVQVIDGLKTGDTVAIELLDSPADEAAAPGSDLSEARARIARLGCGSGSGDVGGALRRCRQALAKSSNPVKELYVITDFQRIAWPEGLRDALGDFPRDVPVYLVDVGGETPRNLAVQHVDFSRKVAVAGAVTHIECRIENTGREIVNTTAALYVEGNKVAEKPVSVAAGASLSTAFEYTFRDARPWSGWVQTGEDDLPLDNRRFFAAQVLDTIRVLIVNGEPSAFPYKDGAFFLKAALQCGLQPNQLSPVRVDVVAPQEFGGLDLSRYACVVLANVARIEEDWPRRLADYAQQGGGVLVFCGDRVDPASYNIHFARALTTGASLFPGPLGDVKDARGREEGFFRVQRADSGHPIFRDIIRQIDLGTTQVRQFITTGGEGGREWAALVQLDEGALLLEHRLGAGSVILCATSCTPAWTNLPLKPYFLPVMHQIVYYVGRAASEQLSGTVGLSYGLPVRGSDKPVEVKFTPPPVKGNAAPRPPVAVRSGLAAGENKAVLADTAQPGVYAAEYAVTGEARRKLFAVNPPPRESDLARLTPEEARARTGLSKCVIVKEADKLASVVRLERHGLPLWDYLLALALAVAVVEIFVGNVWLKH